MLGGTDWEVSRETGPRGMAVTGTSISDAGVPKRQTSIGEAVQQELAETIGLGLGSTLCARGIERRGRLFKLSCGPAVWERTGEWRDGYAW
jgi:hypothetical protein